MHLSNALSFKIGARHGVPSEGHGKKGAAWGSILGAGYRPHRVG